MWILAVGFISAAASWLFKPVGLVLFLIAFVPLAWALFSGPIMVMFDPSAAGQVTGGIITSVANYITGELLNYPGALLFGSLLGLFIANG